MESSFQTTWILIIIQSNADYLGFLFDESNIVFVESLPMDQAEPWTNSWQLIILNLFLMQKIFLFDCVAKYKCEKLSREQLSLRDDSEDLLSF